MNKSTEIVQDLGWQRENSLTTYKEITLTMKGLVHSMDRKDHHKNHYKQNNPLWEKVQWCSKKVEKNFNCIFYIILS